MKVTGYKLREAIKEWELRRDAAQESFDGTLAKFDDEAKESPLVVMETINKCEKIIAHLQTVQVAYNLSVRVDVLGEQISLAEAVKRVGGVERSELMWRNAMRALAPARSYSRNRLTYGGAVANQEEMAKATLTQADAREQTSLAAKMVGAVKAAIATGNCFELDITDLNPELIP